MEFAVYKSSIDGMCGGGRYTIDEALNEVHNIVGWESRKAFKSAVRKWAASAKPGSAFPTAYSVFVCIGIGASLTCECDQCASDDLDTEEFNCGEEGEVTQRVTCNNCGRAWEDSFVLAERRVMQEGGAA